MATKDEEFTIGKSSFLSSCESNIYVPQQLLEVNELVKSISSRLEDCALEWQAEISRKQWKIFNSKAIRNSLYEQSLLERTYFSEKRLDETFQHLLAYNKLFSEYLNSFIDLLQGKLSNSTSDQTYNIENQCFNTKCKILSSLNMEPVNFPTAKNKYLNQTRKFQNYIDDIVAVQNLFTDVVSAKDNFDTKFVGFETVLHKIISVPTNAVCHHRYWSNITRTIPTENKNFANTVVNQRNQIVTKAKYSTRSKKLFKKKNLKKSSQLINNVDDKLLFTRRTKFC